MESGTVGGGTGRDIAAILSIIINDELHPIAFLSHTFTSTELNYNVHDKELLAILEAFKK